jgi:hypothetical protein
MISTPTVLIVGAGGSAPFDFPVGRKLLEDIIKIMSDMSSKQCNTVSEYLVAQERQKDMKNPASFYQPAVRTRILEFVKHFDKSQLASIDAFLEKRKEYSNIGQLAIAAVLIPFENPNSFSRKPRFLESDRENQTWYEYLFDILLKGDIDNFRQNKLSVLTFNYDRSFEYCLSTALESTYNLSPLKSRQLMEEVIPIVHLYGSLGELQGANARDYSNRLDTMSLGIASSSVKIIDTAREDTEEFQKAHMLIKEARKLVFVGFGFDPTNLERLKIHDHFTGQEIYATAYGLEEEEIDKRIYSPLHQQDPNFHLNIDRTGSMATKALHKLMPFED